LDVADIHTHTARRWGWEQADRYVQFVLGEALKAAAGEKKRKVVPYRPGRFYITARWQKSKAGHRIVYEIIPNGIFVVRVLHTSMDWLRHIKR
jgi:plasmid stabilization system protein ParE